MLKKIKNPDKKLDGSQYFKKHSYFEEDKVDVGTKNNVAQVRIPPYTIFESKEERLLNMLK